MVSCRELRARGWNNLKDVGYFPSLLASFLSAVIASAFAPITTGPARVGNARYYLVQSKDKRNEVELILSGFTQHLGINILAYLLGMVFVFLWSLLLIVPGIIKQLAYFAVPYILADNPDLSPSQVLDESNRLMNGFKWKLFKLELSFIGWFLLGALLFGFGTIFVLPYFEATMAEFYQEVLCCQAPDASEACV